MNVLIVYAHPEPKSFNGAMKDVAVETLRGAGHEVVVSDLYAMGFNPVAGQGDMMGERSKTESFSLAREQTVAYENGTLASDIKVEQEKLRKADLVIFQFPIWWFGMPAIMKGWADRVFARGFAYLPGRKYDTGLMKGKLALVINASLKVYRRDGWFWRRNAGLELYQS
jgi:NAD(P)H dehydrogenase (quinone)